jgi:predicted glycosyltransferase
MLGVPSIRMNSFVGKISYLEEQEKKYGLTYGFKPADFNKMLAKIDELLAMPNLKEEWQRRRQKMLEEKMDVTAYLVEGLGA